MRSKTIKYFFHDRNESDTSIVTTLVKKFQILHRFVNITLHNIIIIKKCFLIMSGRRKIKQIYLTNHFDGFYELPMR